MSDKADQLDDALASGDMHAMYTQLGALTKYANNKTSAQKVCRVSNADGFPTQSYTEEKITFREHFSKTMSGKTVTYGEVIHKDRGECNSIGCHDRYSHLSYDKMFQQVPSPSETFGMRSMSKKGKAPGEDLCSGKVLCAFPMDLMRTHYPLILKTYVRIQHRSNEKGECGRN